MVTSAPLPGAEISTLRAPPFRCRAAPSRLRNFPVDSITTSAPSLPQRSEERRVGSDWSSDVCSSDLRCRDQYLARAALQVQGRAVPAAEFPGGLDHHVGAELAPVDLRWIPFGQHRDR